MWSVHISLWWSPSQHFSHNHHSHFKINEADDVMDTNQFELLTEVHLYVYVTAVKVVLHVVTV